MNADKLPEHWRRYVVRYQPENPVEQRPICRNRRRANRVSAPKFSSALICVHRRPSLIPGSYDFTGLSETFHFFSSKYRTFPCRYESTAMEISTCAQAPVSTSRCGFLRVRMDSRKLLMCAVIESY